MKKIISILLTAVLLGTLLSVFVLPASAEQLKWTGDKSISSGVVYKDDIKLGNSVGYFPNPSEEVPCRLVIGSNASVTFDGKFDVDYGSTVLIRDGATVTFNGDVYIGGSCKLTIEGGATVTFNGTLSPAGSTPNFLIESGAVVTLNKGLPFYTNPGALRVCGTLTGKCESFSDMGILLSPGGTVDLEFTNEADAKKLVENLQSLYQNPDFSPYTGPTSSASGSSVTNFGMADWNAQDKQNDKLKGLRAFYTSEVFDPHAEYKEVAPGVWRVTAHVHEYPSCKDCGGGAANGDADGAGSILSGGSLAIIVGIACLVVGFLVAMFIFKKKKPALASGENKDLTKFASDDSMIKTKRS